MQRPFYQNLKRRSIRNPEYYLVLLTLLAAYQPPFSFHPIMLGGVGIWCLQIFFQNKYLGIGLASLFTLFNVYMLSALFSEFNEFPDFNAKAQQLLLVGLLIWILNMMVGILLFNKYIKLFGPKTSSC